MNLFWRSKIRVCGFIIAVLFFHKALPGQYLEKIYTTPDYTQTDPAYGGFPGAGLNYCAPVSVSNSIMWFSDNGFPNLSSHTVDPKRDQFDVAKSLGADYMSAIDGTSANELCKGVKNYVLDNGYAHNRLEYQGWRYIWNEFDTGVDVPDLDWIRDSIEGLGSVWLNVGWYAYSTATDTYTRFGGHWITLVGHGHDGSNANTDYLIAHDPAPRAGTTFANEYILPVRVDSGTLTGSYSGLPRSAAGFYKMMDGMHIKSSADFGILDGVVVLEMVPEPATILLLGLGAVLLRKRR